jgi:branched-chain amino acid transport system ATP-binding protein
VGEGETGGGPLLLIEGLQRSFGSVVVADDLTFSLAPGETLGVVGPNGAGKTSMLNLITGSLAPQAGRIRLGGIDITALPAHRRAALGVGRTYQIPRPFETMTVFENVLVGAVHAAGNRLAGDAPIDLAVGALERTDLLRRANVVAGALPLLDRKRLELARALATRPRLLLLDEIAGGLTEAEVGDLVDTIRRLKADGLTILWIEHIVQALLSVVDRLMATSYGRKLAEGEPRAVLADPTVRAVYLGTEPAA